MEIAVKEMPMKLDYKRKKVQERYKEAIRNKNENTKRTILINIISIIVIVMFILNLYIKWL